MLSQLSVNQLVFPVDISAGWSVCKLNTSSNSTAIRAFVALTLHWHPIPPHTPHTQPLKKCHCLLSPSPCLNMSFFSWLPQTVTAGHITPTHKHIVWTVNKQWCPSTVDGWVALETYQVRAHVPVSRECTIETERFFHFQKCMSFCSTTFGTGSLCKSLWVILKSREHTNTEGPGWLLSTGSRASIPRSIWTFLLIPGSSLASFTFLSPSPGRWWAGALGMYVTGMSCREKRGCCSGGRWSSCFGFVGSEARFLVLFWFVLPQTSFPQSR